MPLPKSIKRERQLENADIEWFEISNEDMATLDELDEGLVTDWYAILEPGAVATNWCAGLTIFLGTNSIRKGPDQCALIYYVYILCIYIAGYNSYQTHICLEPRGFLGDNNDLHYP